MLSLAAKLADAHARLTSAGLPAEEAAIDVDLYARTLMDWDRARLIVERAGPVPDSLEPLFSEWIDRRVRREPSAYIVGRREFYGLDFRVSPAVLVPRPESELIVEEALSLLRAMTQPVVGDIGTGSGCLAVILALAVPTCRIVASDVSPDALAVARDNAERLGAADRVTFVETNYLDGIDDVFDLIVSNPPYVKDGDEPGLSSTVRHEPAVALFGGSDGLRHVEGALDTAVLTLRPRGWLVMEFGDGQEDGVRALVAARSSLRLERVRTDLLGIPRTAVIERQ